MPLPLLVSRLLGSALFLPLLATAADLATAATPASPEASPPMTAEAAHRTYLQILRDEKRFPTAASCSQCHPQHYTEWSVSPHAYAMMDPVFNTLHTFITERTSGTNGDFCIRCHSPVGMQREEKMFSSAMLRSPIMIEGISCVVCHRVDRDFGNSSGRISMTHGTVTAPIYGPTGNDGLKKALAEKAFGLVTEDGEIGKAVHRDALKFPVISTSAACAACHDVNVPHGFRIESTFTEWKNSPASQQGISCQDCHMGRTPGSVPAPEQRLTADGRDLNFDLQPAARVRNSPRDRREGLPTTPRKHTNHMMLGPDYSLVHPGLYPHSLEAREFTYGNRFRHAMAQFSQQNDRDEAARRAASEAKRHALSDWITFRWWEGWGTPEFEDALSAQERDRALSDVGFPWADPADPTGSRLRREAARLILCRQFNLLNESFAERTRLLRRALQIKSLHVTRDDDSRGLRFAFDVHNMTNGHSVPSGADADRPMFLEVKVIDAQERVLFQSGDRDPNGDLRDLESSFVHAHAPKTGSWLEQNAWKPNAGLPLQDEDKTWVRDPYLFNLQSRFVTRNLVGGEREQALPVNISLDPLPFIRPSPRAEMHTARAGSVRKHSMTMPPLSHREAEYQVKPDQLSGARPYRIEYRLISQTVPIHFVKAMSSVGFDYNLSPREVATRVVHGQQVSPSAAPESRRGGATVIWAGTIPLDGSAREFDLSPSSDAILHVPLATYPFPHTDPEELAAKEAAMSGAHLEANALLIQNLGPLHPEFWPGGVPEGLPFLPPEALKDLPSAP
ncbi:MAG: hypothetical protein KDK99_09205 [Verrucomicrobiales bacterium]|nr:hypothetical protein [Verrucomicrobiales bacterium]